jgi:hypothetical protein
MFMVKEMIKTLIIRGMDFTRKLFRVLIPPFPSIFRETGSVILSQAYLN